MCTHNVQGERWNPSLIFFFSSLRLNCYRVKLIIFSIIWLIVIVFLLPMWTLWCWSWWGKILTTIGGSLLLLEFELNFIWKNMKGKHGYVSLSYSLEWELSISSLIVRSRLIILFLIIGTLFAGSRRAPAQNWKVLQAIITYISLSQYPQNRYAPDLV